MKSGLATIIGKCADTAIYMSRKRYTDVDDLKVLLFAPEHGEVYMTNGDAVVRISDIPHQVLEGLNPDYPVYDYMAERFVPNSLPYDLRTLEQAFFTDFSFTVTLPVVETLNFIHNKYPDAVARRGTITVLDVGYGLLPDSLIVPRFDHLSGRPVCTFPGFPLCFIGNSSPIQGPAIYLDRAYAAKLVDVKSDAVILDVYKEYVPTTTMGVYKLMDYPIEDDLHPFDLANYADDDKLVAKLTSEIVDDSGLMETFRDFRPIVFETEYLYYILIMLSEFNYREFSVHIRANPTDPFFIEGLKQDPDQPTVEAIIATIVLGADGVRMDQKVNSVV